MQCTCKQRGQCAVCTGLQAQPPRPASDAATLLPSHEAAGQMHDPSSAQPCREPGPPIRADTTQRELCNAPGSSSAGQRSRLITSLLQPHHLLPRLRERVQPPYGNCRCPRHEGRTFPHLPTHTLQTPARSCAGRPPHSYRIAQVGFMVVDALARSEGIDMRKLEKSAALGRGEVAGRKVLLAKPVTFMVRAPAAAGACACACRVDATSGRVRRRSAVAGRAHQALAAERHSCAPRAAAGPCLLSFAPRRRAAPRRTTVARAWWPSQSITRWGPRHAQPALQGPPHARRS